MGNLSLYLKYKLFFMFILVCLLPIILISYFNYYKIKTTLTNSTKDHLKAVVTLKSYEIEKFFERKINDLTTISISPYVINVINLKDQKNSSLYENSIKMLNKQILNFILPREINEVYIYSLNAECLVNIKKNGFSSIQNLNKAIENGTNSLTVSNIYKNKGMVLFTISKPIFDENENKIGVVVIEVNFDRLLNQVQDYIGLGNSGETLLGQKYDNNTVEVINSLKYDKEASFKRKIKIGENIGIPIQQAVNGINDSSIEIDYRGKEVIASWMHIKNANLGIVAKIDADEVFEVSDNARDSILISSGILLLFLSIISFFAMKNIVTPVQIVEKNAHIDKLTGLPNRRALEGLLKRFIKICKIKPDFSSVLFLDLDGFKNVNDTYGHEIGDQLLINVSKELIKLVRQTDNVFRLGGDEFVILLANMQKKENIETVAENIISKLSQPFELDDIVVKIGVSIGITIIDENTNVSEVIKKADEAMYMAKNSGKNRYIFNNR